MRTRTWSAKEFERLLNENDYSLHRQKGSHKCYRNAAQHTIIVAYHNGYINKMMARRIIKEENLK